MKEFHYAIKDPLGIHARPAGELVKALSRFESAIHLQKGDKRADAKRIFGIMGLAVRQGDEIILTAEGTDEAEAIETARKILEAHF